MVDTQAGFHRHASAVPIERVRQAHADSRGVYGSPRVHRKLAARGVHCCHYTVAIIMRQNRLKSRAHWLFKLRTTDSDHGRPVAQNVLDQQFDTAHRDQPNRVGVIDISYVPTREDRLYLAVVLDLYLRRVVGWAMTDHLKGVAGARCVDDGDRRPPRRRRRGFAGVDPPLRPQRAVRQRALLSDARSPGRGQEQEPPE